MSALAIVQARMSSTRLPGKVLADVEGEPMLALLLRRLSRARRVDEVRVATSVLPADEPIAATARELGFAVHRGSLDDVLERFVEAAAGHAGPIVRITADCPFVDPEIVDALVTLRAGSPRCAYASNVDRRTYPDGLDVEVVAKAALLEAHAETSDPVAREHVTAVVRADPRRWPAQALVHEGEDLGALRWTVDTPEDLAFVRAVAAALGARRHEAGLDEILATVRADGKLAAMPGGRRA
jgi:spore coat polysaccharide biosynthesis protein SpsF (cytidylyltransferase family)